MRQRKYSELTVIELKEYKNEIELEVLRKSIFKCPSEIIYFTVRMQLYGCITTGDILRRTCSKISINRNFTVLDKWNSIEAHQIFKEKQNIHKIPVTDNNGILVGDYSRWDDELFFWRNKDEFQTAAVLCVQPVYLAEPVKQKNQGMFCEMKYILQTNDIAFEVIHCEQIPDNYLYAEKEIVIVETDEMKGFMGIYGKESKGKLSTYQTFMKKILEKPYGNAVVFQNLEKKGVHCITINSTGIDNIFCKFYLQRKEERNKQAEEVSRIIYHPMKHEQQEFFCELYCEEYIDDILSIWALEDNISWKNLLVQRNGVNYMKDVKSKFINVTDGERRTVGQPEHADATIYFMGPCIMLGALVGDAYTIESYLQKICNEREYSYKIVNFGAIGEKINFPKLNQISLKKDDVIVMFSPGEDFRKERIDTINLYELAEKYQIPDEWTTNNILHTNHKFNHIIAKEIFNHIINIKKDTEGNGSECSISADIPKLLYLERYFKKIDFTLYQRIGAIVMNCNPFTVGHRYLIEQAYKQVDYLIIFVVEEDKSLYGFEERYAMVREGTKDLEHLLVVPSGQFLLSGTTFPQYFIKIRDEDMVFDAEYDVNQFAEFIAKPLHITCRFVGEEPFDEVTREYNLAMKRILPQKGIEVIEILRKKINGQPVSATLVRKCLTEGRMEDVKNMVPKCILPYI